MATRDERTDSVVYRLAEAKDVRALAAMRSAFTYEDGDPHAAARPDFDTAFEATVGEGIATGRWVIWVAEADDELVSHAFVGLIDKIPRPTREHRYIGYLTNVYTRPRHRGRGIGAQLLARVVDWATAADVELLFVWPSEESVGFYERAGFASERDPLIWTPA